MLAEVLGTALPDPGQAQLHSSWVTFPEFSFLRSVLEGLTTWPPALSALCF